MSVLVYRVAAGVRSVSANDRLSSGRQRGRVEIHDLVKGRTASPTDLRLTRARIGSRIDALIGAGGHGVQGARGW
jgi:hypothetical protein